MAKKDELNFENGNNMAGSEKLKALQAAMDKIEKSFGKGSIMKMGDESVEQVEVIPTGSIGLNVALGVGAYPREFWQRAEERTQNTAKLYDQLGMAEYQAIEVFVKMF